MSLFKLLKLKTKAEKANGSQRSSTDVDLDATAAYEMAVEMAYILTTTRIEVEAYLSGGRFVNNDHLRRLLQNVDDIGDQALAGTKRFEDYVDAVEKWKQAIFQSHPRADKMTSDIENCNLMEKAI